MVILVEYYLFVVAVLVLRTVYETFDLNCRSSILAILLHHDSFCNSYSCCPGFACVWTSDCNNIYSFCFICCCFGAEVLLALGA